MKMKKMVGALALTAALAMGTAPAFAAVGASDAADNMFSTDGGETVIKAEVKNIDENICATVPLNVVVAFGSNGHSTIIAPGADQYKITNTGKAAIKLTDGKIEANSNTTGIDMGWIKAGASDTAAWQDKDGADLTGSHLMLTWGTSSFKTYLAEDHSLMAATNADRMDADFNQTYADFQKWEDITIDTGDAIEIQLGGDVYSSTGISLSETTDTLCKIVYTIAAA